MNETDLRCAACGILFKDVDAGLFRTCSQCRRPDVECRKVRRFQTSDSRGRYTDFKRCSKADWDNAVKAIEDGR